MNKRSQLICAWCGPALLVLLGIGYVGFAGMVPPPSPARSAESIASYYEHRTNRIRIGITIMMLGSGLYVPWSCAIAVQIKRIEGKFSPLAYSQMTSGALISLLFLFPAFLLQAAVYRPGRPPELVQLASDIAFLIFFGATSLIVVQCLSLALAIFQDTRDEPIFPRWVAWFSVWMASLLVLGTLCVFFKTGPFAWDGIVTFWIDFSAFGAWASVVSVSLIRSIYRQAAELAHPAAGVSAKPDPVAAVPHAASE